MVLLKIFLIHAWKGQSEYVKKETLTLSRTTLIIQATKYTLYSVRVNF